MESSEADNNTNDDVLFYFVPPTVSLFMSTGRMFLFMFLFVGILASIIAAYIFVNREDYKTRLSYIQSSWMFGKITNSSFQDYINTVINQKQPFTTYTNGKGDDSTTTTSVPSTAWNNIQTWFGKTILSSYLSPTGAIQSSKSLNPTTNKIVKQLTGSSK